MAMEIKVITEKLELLLYGFGGMAINKDYAGTAFRLSGRMWDVVKTHHLKNKGKNIWVYEVADKVFAGVELEPSSDDPHGLEKMTIRLDKYAYYKHVGPYQLIKRAGQDMTDELTRQGYEVRLPYIEIYGHWTDDETKLETELLMCLK
jgi:effector-binding domain-containing protein